MTTIQRILRALKDHEEFLTIKAMRNVPASQYVSIWFTDVLFESNCLKVSERLSGSHTFYLREQNKRPSDCTVTECGKFGR